MTDMTTFTPFERDLARALDGYLGPRQNVDARAISHAAIAAKPRARSTWRLSLLGAQRLAWLALVGLTLVALLALAIGIGQNQPRPTRAPSATALPSNRAVVVVAAPTASAQADESATPVADTSPFVALFLRAGDAGAADLLEALPDGSERVLRHFPQLAAADADTDLQADHWDMTPYGTISSTGWLAMEVFNPDAYALFDLKDPSRKPWVFSFWGAGGGAWSADGLFAAIDGVPGETISGGPGSFANGTLVIDPDAHVKKHLGGQGSVGGGPSLYWAADGSGVLGYLNNVLGIFPVDGTPFLAGLPRIADSFGGRPFGADGKFVCGGPGDFGAGLAEQSSCPASGLLTSTVGGELTQWSPLSVPAGVIQTAAFTADGTGLWAVAVKNHDDKPLTIQRLDAPGQATEVTTVERSALAYPSEGKVQVSVFGIAPDDSIMVLYQRNQGDGQVPDGEIYVSTDGSGAHAHVGRSVGFVTSDRLATWTARGAVATSGPTVIGSPSAAPRLRALPSVASVANGYVPVIARSVGRPGKEVDVFVVQPDGAERLVRKLRPADNELSATGEYSPSVTISNAGLLEIPVTTAADCNDGCEYAPVTVFYDLNNPLSATWAVPIAYLNHNISRWALNGLFAMTARTIVDPAEQQIWVVDTASPGSDPGGVVWTADGTGVYLGGLPNIMPVDGGQAFTDFPPTGDASGTSRYVGADGVVLCSKEDLFLASSSTGCASSFAPIATASQTDPLTDWSAMLPPGAAVWDYTFAADERSLWALTNEPASSTLDLVKLASPDHVDVVATLPYAGSQIDPASDGYTRFMGFAPDDSVVAVGIDPFVDSAHLYVNPATGDMQVHQGALAGFVPADMAAQWPTVAQ